MLARLLLISVAGALTICSAAAHEVNYQGLFALSNRILTFDNGYVAAYEHGSFSLYGPDGALRYKATADAPAAKFTLEWNVAVDREGVAVAAVYYHVPNGVDRFREAGGLALFDAQGNQVRFIRTGNYIPSQVAFAPDGSIYTIGYLGNQKWAEHPDYSVLRQYSRDGQELLAAVPRTSINPSPEDSYPDPVRSSIGLWGLRVTKERVGFWAFRGDLKRMEWLETDLNGKQLGRWKLDKDRGEFALTASGTLYTNNYGHGGARFDRATATWKPVPGMPDGTLLGADGDSLVFLDRASSLVRWMQPGN